MKKALATERNVTQSMPAKDKVNIIIIIIITSSSSCRATAAVVAAAAAAAAAAVKSMTMQTSVNERRLGSSHDAKTTTPLTRTYANTYQHDSLCHQLP